MLSLLSNVLLYSSNTFFSVADPWHFGVDPDPGIFFIDLQDAYKKLFFYLKFFSLLLFEGTIVSVFKVKNEKEVTKQ